MRKYILISILVGIMVTQAAAQEYAITAEPRPTVNRHRIAEVIINDVQKRAYVVVQRGYLDGSDFVEVSRFRVEFINTSDDPSTPEDETDNKYNQFINIIKISQAGIVTAVKAQLGI